MDKIEMVDLKSQYEKIQTEIDNRIQQVLKKTDFINGEEVALFTQGLSEYLDNAYIIPCANGTDALQIAMMALDLRPGDEVIVPSFTYVATAEVLGLLNICPVMVDVDPKTYNVTAKNIEAAITPKTKAIVPVHLFGQCADMESILALAKRYNLYVIEDTAQAIGAEYTFSDGKKMKAGTMGDIGCTSFFPSKNLGCYGDGGALYTMDEKLANKIKMIANHGQEKKYVHKLVGVNSRLDTIQAAVLNVKLRYLDEYSEKRRNAADTYDNLLKNIEHVITPFRSVSSTHVFHQYTLVVGNGARDDLKSHLSDNDIPAMIYYPVPLNEQEAYLSIGKVSGSLDVTNALCKSVLSLPMHTELSLTQQAYIVETIKSFFI